MNFLANLVRSVFIAILALAGLAMAFVLMLSTAIALGVMYVVAKVRGRPFALAQMWQARRGTQWSFVRTPGAGPSAPAEGDAVYTRDAAVRRPSRPARERNVIDVEARDIG
ncbi:hypothetical protein FOZ76_13995 [Verticiella sediminum]|uniref:Uncharacterized protein n=1 Tax=Verticiella sediminum TaxID=1247510 RepID=A0A556AKE4_9BURK|nr:hypothetical protein [Verticiella sediminum]TSH93372.1 hypothetical protein FOZ76_13995 [Verticiella sediminum]